MDKRYNDWDKDTLIDYIQKLEDSLKRKEKDFAVNFQWAGNLGQWSWYYKENVVVFNEMKAKAIGYDPSTLDSVGFQFYTEKLHPDDYENVMDNMRQHLMGKTEAYEVEYRIQHKEGHYVWYYDRGIVTKRDTDGTPLVIEGIVFDVTKSKNIEEELKFFAEQDTLTKTLNRRMLFEYLEHLISKYPKDKKTFSLVMLDIDQFKMVNDTYGHLAGDDVLIALSNTLNEVKRKDDFVFRYGGDEFFILLPNTNMSGANELAERLVMAVDNIKVPTVGKISISLGFSEYQTNETVDEFVNRVDQIMYISKQSNKKIR